MTRNLELGRKSSLGILLHSGFTFLSSSFFSSSSFLLVVKTSRWPIILQISTHIGFDFPSRQPISRWKTTRREIESRRLNTIAHTETRLVTRDLLNYDRGCCPPQRSCSRVFQPPISILNPIDVLSSRSWTLVLITSNAIRRVSPDR